VLPTSAVRHTLGCSRRPMARQLRGSKDGAIGIESRPDGAVNEAFGCSCASVVPHAHSREHGYSQGQ